MSQAGIIDVITSTPSIATRFDADAGFAVPALNTIDIVGVAAQGISTSAAGHTITVTAANATTTTKGVASFDATKFTVAAGVVSLVTPVSSLVYAYTPTAATPYTVLTTDACIGVDCSGGAKQVNLPNAPSVGSAWIIKDVTGNCAANNITVTTSAGVVLIDLAATYVLNIAYASITAVWTGTKYIVI